MPFSSTAYQAEQKHLKLGAEFYDPVQAVNFPDLKLRFRNQPAANSIGLDGLTDDEWLDHFGRFSPLPGNLPEPLALRYHGHQFRSYNPDIGDGRGFLFAQARDNKSRLLDLGTKGSGPTPWSRGGDGRLTLKGGVREVLATELLQALGVYTSKSFSLIETGEALQRHDEPSPTRSAVLVRLNHSHIRIGTFQRLLYEDNHAAIEKLVHYCIENYYPSAVGADEPVLAFFSKVVTSVAKLGAEWFAAGFVHGVLNTDNITITGESFDYGPWRFLPILDADFTAAYFDQTGLYAFGRQPEALYWNLARLAECLIPISDLDNLKLALKGFSEQFEQALQVQTLARLGISNQSSDPDPLVPQFYQTLRDSDAKFEQAFFDLSCRAQKERLAQSPQAPIYERHDMGQLISELRNRDLVSTAEETLNQPEYLPGKGSITLLIDEVEEIWSDIDENDDWTAFENKIAQIRAYGKAQAQLLTGGIKREF